MKRFFLPVILICAIVGTIYTLYVLCQNVWIKSYIIAQIEKNIHFSAYVSSARISLNKLTLRGVELWDNGNKFLSAPKINIYISYKLPFTINPTHICLYKPNIKITQWPPAKKITHKEIQLPIIAKNANIVVDDKVKNIKFSLQNATITLYKDKVTILCAKLFLADTAIKIAHSSIFKDTAKVKLQKQTIHQTKSLQRYLPNLKFEALKIEAAELQLNNFTDINLLNSCFEIYGLKINFYQYPIYIDKIRLMWHLGKIWGYFVYKNKLIKYCGRLDFNKKLLFFNIAKMKLNNVITLPHLIAKDYMIFTKGYVFWGKVPHAQLFFLTGQDLKDKVYMFWQKDRPINIILSGAKIILHPKKDKFTANVTIYNSDIFKIFSVKLPYRIPHKISGEVEISWSNIVGENIVGSLTFHEGLLKYVYINKIHNNTNVEFKTFSGGKLALTITEQHKFCANFDNIDLFGKQTLSGTVYGTWSPQNNYICANFPQISTQDFNLKNLFVGFQYLVDELSNIHISAISTDYGKINMQQGCWNIKDNVVKFNWITTEKPNIKVYDAKFKFHTSTVSLTAAAIYENLPLCNIAGIINLSSLEESLIKCRWQRINIESLQYPFTKNLEGQIEMNLHYSKNTTTFTLTSPQINIVGENLKVENLYLNGAIDGGQIKGIISGGKLQHYGFVAQINQINFDVASNYLRCFGSLSQKERGKLTIENLTVKDKAIDAAVELKHFLILGKPTWANLKIHGTISPTQLFGEINNLSIGNLKIASPISGLFVKEGDSFIVSSTGKSTVCFYAKANTNQDKIIFERMKFSGVGVSFCGSGHLSGGVFYGDLRDLAIDLSNLPIDRTGTINGDVKITWNLKERILSVKSKENLRVKVDDWLDGYVWLVCDIWLSEAFKVCGNLKFKDSCFSYPRPSKYITKYERDLLLIVDKNVRYRTAYLDVKLKPASFLHITKQRGEPIYIDGELESEAGILKYLGRTFTIDKGRMYWQRPSIEPKVSLHAHSTLDSKVITLTYDGYLRGGVPHLSIAGLSREQTVELLVPGGVELFAYGLKQLIFMPLEQIFLEPVFKPIRARISKIIGAKVYVEVTPILMQFIPQTQILPQTYQALQIILTKKKGKTLYKFQYQLSPSTLSPLQETFSIERRLRKNTSIKYSYVNLKNKKEKYHEFSIWQSFTF